MTAAQSIHVLLQINTWGERPLAKWPAHGTTREQMEQSDDGFSLTESGTALGRGNQGGLAAQNARSPDGVSLAAAAGEAGTALPKRTVTGSFFACSGGAQTQLGTSIPLGRRRMIPL